MTQCSNVASGLPLQLYDAMLTLADVQLLHNITRKPTSRGPIFVLHDALEKHARLRALTPPQTREGSFAVSVHRVSGSHYDLSQ